MEDSLTHIDQLYYPAWRLDADSLGVNHMFLSTNSPDLPVDLISEIPQLGNFVFIIFLFCFFLISFTIAKKGKMLFAMFDDLIHSKGRQSIFYVEAGTEAYTKFLLLTQSIVLFSIFTYCVFAHHYEVLSWPFSRHLLLLGLFALIILIFFFYKLGTYNAVGLTFFEKEELHQWVDSFISLISLLGIIVFFPTVCLFYIKEAYILCCYFIFFCLLIAEIVIIYKTFILFFHHRSHLLYLFLYLCAQEILPLFFLYKGLFYLFNVVEKNALWL